MSNDGVSELSRSVESPEAGSEAAAAVEADAGPMFDSPLQELFLSLWRSYDRLKVLEDELFGGWNLSAQQYNAMRVLDLTGDEAMPVHRLAAKLVSRAPDMTRLLDRLEERGWIARSRRPDNRRVVDVRITTEGSQLLRKLADAVKDLHERQLGHLSSDEIQHLTKLLASVRRPHEPAGGFWSRGLDPCVSTTTD